MVRKSRFFLFCYFFFLWKLCCILKLEAFVSESKGGSWKLLCQHNKMCLLQVLACYIFPCIVVLLLTLSYGFIIPGSIAFYWQKSESLDRTCTKWNMLRASMMGFQQQACVYGISQVLQSTSCLDGGTSGAQVSHLIKLTESSQSSHSLHKYKWTLLEPLQFKVLKKWVIKGCVHILNVLKMTVSSGNLSTK